MSKRAIPSGRFRIRLTGVFAFVFTLQPADADQVIHRYEGNVVPYDPSAGWDVFDPCTPPCVESLDSGHFVAIWAQADDTFNYSYLVSETPTPPPPTFWVEWRFRSNHAIGTIFTGCDASFSVNYKAIAKAIDFYGDTAIGGGGRRHRGAGHR